ncbi:O-antigen ligase family protein [Cribrihabitans neustonicus]|uniref:O-antigen ligase family protein n=1 Tax=Cribrihabitans neustonicus TaxID=1429085 RepID=UPI003B5D00C6
MQLYGEELSRPRPGRDAIGLGTGIFAAGIFLSGVLINPLNPAQEIRIVAADLCFLLGTFLFLLTSTSKQGVLRLRLHPNTRAILLVLGAFLLWAFLSGVVATYLYDQPMRKLFQTIANYSYGAVLCAVTIAASAGARSFRLFLNAYAAGVVLVSSFSVLAVFAEAPDWVYHGGGRIKSTSQSVNQLAAFVAPALPLFLILCLRASVSRATTLAYFTIVGFAAVALAGTGSRTALVLALVSFLLVVLAALMFWASRPGFAAVILASCAALVLGFALLVIAFLEAGASALPGFLETLARPLDRFLNPSTLEDGLGPRYEQMVLVWRGWVDHPFFGVGPGNFKSYTVSDFEVHNTYLGTLIETGVPGLLLLLLFQAAIMLMALKCAFGPGPGARRIQAFALFAAFLIVSLYGLGSFGLRQRPFWILAGLALSVLNRHWLGPGCFSGPYYDDGRYYGRTAQCSG